MPALGEIKIEDYDQLDKLAKEELLSRQKVINLAWSYYKREHKKWLIDPESKKPTPENVTVNLTRRVINQTVAFLFGKAPQISAGEELADVVSSLIKENEEGKFFTSLGQEGSVSGHCFVKLFPEGNGVRWIVQDSRLVRAFWRFDDGRQAVAYMIKWGDKKSSYRQDILLNPVTKKWMIRDLQKEGSDAWKDWGTTAWEWNFDFSPIVDWQNMPDQSSYYCESDLIALELNDATNFTASNINAILKYHASPKTIGTGISADQIKETAVNGFFTTENENAKVYNLEIGGEALANSMAFLEFERDSFFSESQAVDMSKLKEKANDITNFALRVMFADALEKNNLKQQSYGAGLEKLIKRSLIILGKAAASLPVKILWNDPLPINKTEIATNAQIGVTAGWMSLKTASEETGHNWEKEKASIDAEKAEEGDDLAAKVLKLVADEQDAGAV